MSGSPVFAPGLLAGRVALVTGGGTGIGFGIASCLAACGASVALASRDTERLERAAERLRAGHGGKVLAVGANVREPDSVREAIRRTVGKLGSLDILVNNAAGNFHCPSEELSPNGWRAVVETDLYGTFFACQAAFPHLRERGRGRIISISMTLHYRGWAYMAHATAAKAGVDALTRTLALEWARHGITVNVVAPGPVPTEGVRRAFAPPDSEARAGEQAPRAKAGEDGGGTPGPFGPRSAGEFARLYIPVGRPGKPEDIGHVVAYLASPAADWITGAVFVVDGGESLASPRAVPTAG